MNEKDPLDKIFVKVGDINKALLSDLLVENVRIDEKGNIFPLNQFYQQTNKNKIILILLAKKAIKLKLGLDEATQPKDLSKLLDIPDGSLRPTLRILVDEHIAEENDSKYSIFAHAIERCAEQLKKTDSANGLNKVAEQKNHSRKISMRETIEGIIASGNLDEPKSARELYEIVRQKRPETLFQAHYKVLHDLLNQKKLGRELVDRTWKYKRVVS